MTGSLLAHSRPPDGKRAMVLKLRLWGGRNKIERSFLGDAMALVRDVMTTALITVPQDAEVDVAIELMVRNQVSAVAVVDSRGALAGVISEYDVLQLLEQADGSS